MAMTATTNTSANTALRYLGINNAASASSLAKLSSGSRIVRASDDAASLAVGTKLKADVTALKQAQVNAGQASSVLQVADGALAQTVDILMRMKALSVQAQSGSVSDNERAFLDKEFQALAKQIDSIAEQTKFNGETLLNGTSSFGAVIETGTSAFDPAGANTLTLLSNSGFLKDGVEYALTYAVADFALGPPAASNVTYTLTGADGSTATSTVAAGGSATFGVGPISLTDASGNGVILGIGAGAIQLDASANAAAGQAIAGGSTFTANAGVQFQVGVASVDTISVALGATRTNVMGAYQGATATLADAAGDGSNVKASVTSQANAVIAGGILDNAISQINEARANVGAQISRFDFAAANLATTVENLDAARSVLMDVDMAAEMSNFSSKQVLLQASVAMLAQANQQPQQLLRLLG
jgi:flagellin